MTDPNFEALRSNPTLGAAANGVFLDVMEAQLNENRAAAVEGRPARIAKRDQRFPGWEQGKEISSTYSDVTFGDEFEDGEAVRVPQGGPEVPTGVQGVVARQAARTPTKPLLEPAKATPSPVKPETKGTSK